MKVIDEPGMTLYYSQDLEFKRPRNAYVIRIRRPKATVDLKSYVLSDFYVKVMNEILNEETYAAQTAGLQYSLSSSLEGLLLQVSGWSDKTDDLLALLLERMKKLDLPDERFEALKEERMRELENATKAQAWTQSRELQYKQHYNTHFTPQEQLPNARSVTLDEIREFTGHLFSQGAIEAVAHWEPGAGRSYAGGTPDAENAGDQTGGGRSAVLS